MQETPHYNTEISQKDVFQEKKNPELLPTTSKLKENRGHM